MFARKCPECKLDITYGSKGAYTNGIKKNSTCRACTSKRTGFISRFATKGENTGSINAFYGKKHTEISKKKISGRAKARELHPKFKEKIGNKANLIKGGVYEFWTAKYGKAIANQKLKALKKKHSQNNSGIGNPMYGKPCPGGAGYGWKGWYKGHFFRSLRELSFMIANNDWKSAEHIRIEYEYNNSARTYRPDFILGTRVIEIKPKKLHNTSLIQAKADAAKKHCASLGMTYELLDQEIVKFETLDNLVTNKEVIWHDRYKQRYEAYKEAYNL